MSSTTITALMGKKIIKVVNNGDFYLYVKDSTVKFFKFYHNQDCCESVFLEDVVGDLDDLIGSPIIKAEVRTSTEETPIDPEDYLDDSNTWTFFELATVKGSVTLRWWGSSNGYYSEDVDVVAVLKNGSTEHVYDAYGCN